MRKKSEKEKMVVVSLVLILMLSSLCLMGCGGSCAGCSWGCESGEGYHLGGISYLADGCCSNSSCQTAAGSLDTEDEMATVSDLVLLSCTESSRGCGGDSSCYSGCYIGKDSDCGDFGITCGSNKGDNVDETTVGCVDGCFNCEGEEGEMGFFYEFVYSLLGI